MEVVYVTAPSRFTRVNDKYRRMCEIYKIFSPDNCPSLTHTEEDMLELFNQESLGGTVSETNGYYWGKVWMSITVKMWKEDIQNKLLFLFELYEDPKFPHWWLDSVFKVGRAIAGNRGSSGHTERL